MPLILAVAPDRQQALRVAALAPAHVDAEVVIVESVEAALAVLDQRTPDLVLTPLLVSAKDDAALTARLRELSTTDHELQTLVTPLLADKTPQGGPEPRNGSLLGRMRKKRAPAAADGCDPAVFAAQINEYLARSAAAREELRAVQEQPAVPVATAPASAPMLQEWLTSPEVRTPRTLAQFDVPLEREFRAASVEFVPMARDLHLAPAEPPAVNLIERNADPPAGLEREAELDRHATVVFEPLPVVSEGEPPAVAADRLADAPVEAAAMTPATAIAVPLEEETDILPAIAATATADTLPATLTAPASETLSSVVTITRTEALASAPASTTSDTREPWRSVDVATSQPSADTETAGEVIAAPAQEPTPGPERRPKRPKMPRGRRPAPQRKPAPRPRPEPARPLQDEWGLYDPEQCGFAALLDRLEQITEAEPRDTGREKRSAIMRR